MQGAGPSYLLAIVECIAANCIIGLQMPPATGTTWPGSSTKYLCIICSICKLLFYGQDVDLVYVMNEISLEFPFTFCHALNFETRSIENISHFIFRVVAGAGAGGAPGCFCVWCE